MGDFDTAIHNLTPLQRSMSKEIRREAYRRIPMSCDRVRQILDEAKWSIILDVEVLDAADEAVVDAAISQAFLKLRDEVMHPFRDEQMGLLALTREVDKANDRKAT